MSDRSDSKLQAVLNHDRSDHDDLGASYRGACKVVRAAHDRDKEIAREAAEVSRADTTRRTDRRGPATGSISLLHEAIDPRDFKRPPW
jgi:hypothetical protein